MTVRKLRNSKSEKLVNDIIRTEQLDVFVEYQTDSLGDDFIVISGNDEEIKILKEIYNMVY